MAFGEQIRYELEKKRKALSVYGRARWRGDGRGVQSPKANPSDAKIRRLMLVFARRESDIKPEPSRSILLLWRRKGHNEPPSLPERSPDYTLVEHVGRSVIAYDSKSRTAYVWLRRKNLKKMGYWSFLKPLVENRDVLEIHVRGKNVAITHAKLGRYRVHYMDLAISDSLVARLVSNLSAYARATADFEKPSGYGELDGWRVYVKLDIVSGAPEMIATRIIEIPDLTEWLNPGAAAKVLTLALLPHATVIFGPPGSGKTTFLNSLLNKVLELFPWLSVSVVETIPELVLPEAPNVHRTAPMLAEEKLSVSEAVSRAFRFERPHLLVLGELRGDELRSWVEVARAGIPALTTVHAPNLDRCLSTLSSLLEREGVKLELTDHFRVFIEMGRIENKRITRYVKGIYLFIDGSPLVIYGPEELEEEAFLEVIRGEDTLLGPAEKLYSKIRAFS